MRYILRNINNKFNIFSLPIASTNITLSESIFSLLLSSLTFFITSINHILPEEEALLKKAYKLSSECVEYKKEYRLLKEQLQEELKEVKIKEIEEKIKKIKEIEEKIKKIKEIEIEIMKTMIELKEKYNNKNLLGIIIYIRNTEFIRTRIIKIEDNTFIFVNYKSTIYIRRDISNIIKKILKVNRKGEELYSIDIDIPISMSISNMSDEEIYNKIRENINKWGNINQKI